MGQFNPIYFRFDALDTLVNIVSELKANDKTKTELKDKLTVSFPTIMNLNNRISGDSLSLTSRRVLKMVGQGVDGTVKPLD